MTTTMSTNIDDLPDPHFDPQHQNIPPDLQKKELNTNINHILKPSIPIDHQLSQSNSSQPQITFHEQNLNTNSYLNETNLFVFIMIILASLPYGNNILYKIIPKNLHNNLLINIIKATLLFIIYMLVILYVL